MLILYPNKIQFLHKHLKLIHNCKATKSTMKMALYPTYCAAPESCQNISKTTKRASIHRRPILIHFTAYQQNPGRESLIETFDAINTSNTLLYKLKLQTSETGYYLYFHFSRPQMLIEACKVIHYN